MTEMRNQPLDIYFHLISEWEEIVVVKIGIALRSISENLFWENQLHSRPGVIQRITKLLVGYEFNIELCIAGD